MKKASKYLKQLFSTIVAVVKARSMAVGTKASSLRTRLLVLSIMRNKKLLLSAIQNKIHAIMGGASSSAAYINAVASRSHHGAGVDDDRGGGVAGEHAHGGDGYQHLLAGSSLPSFALEREGSGSFARSPLPGGESAAEDNDNDNGEKSQLAVEAAALPGSAVELARSAAEGGAEFRLEDEIDRVADVFIRRFHDQMKLQKLESFKRFCEMLEKGA
ncbi:hypothetical protein PR202_ga01486 [Eleusine coracana subsp. coracana]|uniref:Uncharacterized protein n=1 Tax=Eleusine coracana subsp. coracana TaxID=191504 RepID=A0AAV5BGY6_ELECO|nr:hypothetical protein PR202_ga00799 [Eleusine coracana subsp. coracana]GJM85696.1 hypothetical protein PR202_ga01486 [Eleusine coracana subsp. coracana]